VHFVASPLLPISIRLLFSNSYNIRISGGALFVFVLKRPLILMEWRESTNCEKGYGVLPSIEMNT
jgi:hypothetical protein